MLTKAGITPASAEIGMVPQNYIKLTGPQATQMVRLVEALEEQPPRFIDRHGVLAPTLVGLDRDLQMPTDVLQIGALSQQLIRLPKLPYHLLRRVPPPFTRVTSLAHSGDRDSHNGWTRIRGSRHR